MTQEFDFHGQIIEINGSRYWYEVTNEHTADLPGIVLIHGLSGNRTRLQVLWDHFRSLGYPLLRMDIKGHGESKNPAGTDYTLATEAAEIHTLIERYFVNPFRISKVILIGHSLGGMLAQKIAGMQPPYLEKLILFCTLARIPPKTKRLARMGVKLYPLMRKFIQVSNKIGHKQAGLEHFPEYFPQYKYLRYDHEAYRAYLNEISQLDLIENDHRIQVPTLIFGGANDELMNSTELEFLRDQIPGARLKVYPKCKHYPFWNYQADVLEEVDRFIKEKKNV
jgi:pimeloyl-ACP methyl ester carboxylesterase